jgi:uncharacterized membrane protein YuzA (DUF378 family)
MTVGDDCSQCFPSHSHALTQLHDVYSSPALSHLDDTKNNGFFQAIGNAAINFLNHIFGAAGSGVATIVFLLIFAGLVALVVWWVIRSSAPRHNIAQHEPAGSADPDLEWTAALAAAKTSDYREAVRRAFRSALLSVAIKGRMAVDPAWTNRELLQRASADPALLAALAPAANLFEVSWYSAEPTTQTMWLTERDRCQAIITLAKHAVPMDVTPA